MVSPANIVAGLGWGELTFLFAYADFDANEAEFFFCVCSWSCGVCGNKWPPFRTRISLRCPGATSWATSSRFSGFLKLFRGPCKLSRARARKLRKKKMSKNVGHALATGTTRMKQSGLMKQPPVSYAKYDVLPVMHCAARCCDPV